MDIFASLIDLAFWLFTLIIIEDRKSLIFYLLVLFNLKYNKRNQIDPGKKNKFKIVCTRQNLKEVE